MQSTLRRGWYWGGQEFRERLEKLIPKMKNRNYRSSALGRDAGIADARKILHRAERHFGLGDGEAGALTQRGHFNRGGAIPVNVSGGHLGAGYLYDAASLYRVAEVVDQLRHDAGRHQLEDVECGLVQSWRGVPTATGGVAVLSVED